jgi:hypothetical protein
MLRGVTLRALLMSLVLGLISYTPASAEPLSFGASVEVDAGVFHENLSPYGEWVDVDNYGWVFRPRVAEGWRPYTLGHWVWSDDDGWVWVSDEDFGWAVYHYGRWYPDPSYGWLWVPGYDWAPAWVAWREGDGFIGWAPLAPGITWSVGFGFNYGWTRFDALISPRAYCFVPERSFADRAIFRSVAPIERNTTIIRATTNLTNYATVQGRVVNRGVSVTQVERLTGHPVPRARLRTVNTVEEARQARRGGGSVAVFRPTIRPAAGSWPAHGTRAPARGERVANGTTGQSTRFGERNNTQGTVAQQRQATRSLSKQDQGQQRAAEQRLAQDRQEQDRQKRQAAQQAQADARATQNRLAQERKQRDTELRQLAQQHQAAQRATEQRFSEDRKEQDRQRREAAQQAQAEERATQKRLAQERTQQDAERKSLEKRQAQERQVLERQHQQEVRSARGNATSPQDVIKRQEQEHQTLAARHDQEQQALQARQQQARQQGAPRAPTRTAEVRPRNQPQPQPRKSHSPGRN